MPEEINHSFAFSFNHAHLFRNGFMPTIKEVRNELYMEQDTRNRKGYIIEDFSHYESAAFELSIFAARECSHYLYLGFDLDFAPVYLITSDNVDDSNTSNDSDLDSGDFNGMYRRKNPRMALSRLLAIIDNPSCPDTVLAFKVRPGEADTIQCQELSLSIDFRLKEARKFLPGTGINGRIWHVTSCDPYP